MGRPVDPRGDCHHLTGQPEHRLASGVIAYRDFRLPCGPPQHRLFAPAGHVSLFIAMDGQMKAWDAHAYPGSSLGTTHTTAVHGLHLRPRLLGHTGGMEAVEITFTPWAAHRFFGESMADLTDTVVEAGDLLGRRIQHLGDQLSHAPDGPARFQVLDRALLEWTAAAPASLTPDSGVLKAWGLLHRSFGTMAIRDIAEQVRCSTRRLETAFRRQIGVSPKRLARIIRLNRAIHLLGGGTSLVDTALACGYYDQPHLVRDFKALTGTTPGRFRAGPETGRPRPATSGRSAGAPSVPPIGRAERHVIPHPDFL